MKNNFGRKIVYFSRLAARNFKVQSLHPLLSQLARERGERTNTTHWQNQKGSEKHQLSGLSFDIYGDYHCPLSFKQSLSEKGRRLSCLHLSLFKLTRRWFSALGVWHKRHGHWQTKCPFVRKFIIIEWRLQPVPYLQESRQNFEWYAPVSTAETICGYYSHPKTAQISDIHKSCFRKMTT